MDERVTKNKMKLRERRVKTYKKGGLAMKTGKPFIELVELIGIEPTTS